MVATRLRFKIAAEQAGHYYIDLARELSRHHRKLHRSKMEYTVYGGYMIDNPGGTPSDQGRIDFAVSPNTWVTKKAINRGFAMWRKQIAIALSNFDSVQKQVYSDYKILLDEGHDPLGSNILDAVDAQDNSIVGNGSWEYSLLTSQDPALSADTTSSNPAGSNLEIGEPDQFRLMIVGNSHSGSNPNYHKIALIKSWVDSRPIPQQNSDAPDYTTDHTSDPLSNLFDTSDTNDDVLVRYENENDAPPYDMDEPYGMLQSYVANEHNNLQRVATSITNSSNFICNIPGFTALNGLIKVNWQSSTPAEIVLDVESNGVKF